MEETLGKRIASNRKRLALTQDALAEKLGVTAQAVSKWENDQSCPDITMLPKLAEIFDVTTDELLGRQPQKILTAEVVTENNEKESNGVHVEHNGWEFKWDGSRRTYLSFAVWIMLSGFLLFLTESAEMDATLWEILWTSGLLLFGLSGILYPHFSFFRLSCAFLGSYFLCTEVLGQSLDRNFLLPVFLMCFGVSLLVKALKKPKNSQIHFFHHGKPLSKNNSHCTYNGDTFACETYFGENSYPVQLPRLSGGSAEVSFGSMTVDLSGCEEIAEGCQVELACTFGELTLLVPKCYRTEITSSTAFGSVEETGAPDSAAEKAIILSCDAGFGHIIIHHI